MSCGPIVVKVGGSLFDLPDLGSRLHSWLNRLEMEKIALVPGGGPAADVVREMDRIHHLGQEASHWLALAGLSCNALFLQRLLNDIPSVIARDVHDCQEAWAETQLPIVDPHAFALLDETHPDHLPHSWAVTSDSLAARAAHLLSASTLVLLKSMSFPEPIDWCHAVECGWIDQHFTHMVGRIKEIRVVNFRQ